jgi:hypothetical protein
LRRVPAADADGIGLYLSAPQTGQWRRRCRWRARRGSGSRRRPAYRAPALAVENHQLVCLAVLVSASGWSCSKRQLRPSEASRR